MIVARQNLERMGLVEWAERVCARTKPSVPLDAVLGRSRDRLVVERRHELWSLMHGTFGLAYAELGRVFGVDHSTVMGAIRKREMGGR